MKNIWNNKEYTLENKCVPETVKNTANLIQMYYKFNTAYRLTGLLW